MLPTDDPETRSLELPVHLVDGPAARGLRKLGVGTVPFSIVAGFTMLAMSAFVVMGPGSVPDGGVPSELASRDLVADGAPEKPEPRRVVVLRSAPETAPATTATPESSSTTVAAPSTSAALKPKTSSPAKPKAKAKAPSSTAAARSGAAAPSTDAQLASTPVSARPVRCEDFTTQPDAQASFDADRVGRAGLDGDGDGIACEQLPGRVTPAPVSTARRIPTALELLRPETKLYGVHTPNAPYAASELEEFSGLAGKAPNTSLFFQSFSQEFPASALELSWAQGMLPMISLEPIIQDSTVGQPRLRDISDGDWDEYLTRWAAAAKADGRPIALRFAQEMNGNWYSWSDGRFGNAVGDYVRAYRHMHDLFEQVGADNVLWVWSINRIDNLPDKTLARVYPGDGYVDWIGISGYLRSVPEGVAPSFDFTFAQTLAAVRNLAPNKLVMLTEVGAGTTEANRVAWMETFFQGLLDHPEVLGFNWFNAFKDGGDWRIQYSGGTVQAFARGVADVRYGEIAPKLPAPPA